MTIKLGIRMVGHNKSFQFWFSYSHNCTLANGAVFHSVCKAWFVTFSYCAWLWDWLILLCLSAIQWYAQGRLATHCYSLFNLTRSQQGGTTSRAFNTRECALGVCSCHRIEIKSGTSGSNQNFYNYCSWLELKLTVTWLYWPRYLRW